MRSTRTHPRTQALAIASLAVLGILLDASLDAPRARADVKLDVRVDRKSLSLDDVLTLQASVESRGAKAADVSLPSFEGFEIVQQQVQRPMQFSFSFGSGAVVQSSVVYSFVLRPLRVGQITIKSVVAELDGQRRSSSPIAITVTAGSAGGKAVPPDPNANPSANPSQASGTAQNGESNPAAAPTSANGNVVDLAEIDDSAFIRTVADKADPYVGEQVTVTMYLYVRDRLQANPAIELEPTTDGFWIHDLLDQTKQPQPQRQIVKGAVYTVYPLRRFAAFPLKAGELAIGPMAVRIDTSTVFDVFGPRRGNPVISRKGAALPFQVKPLPDAAERSGETAVGRFALTSKLDRAQTATGDAVTLVVTVRGQGNVRTVALPTPSLPGLDVLQPEVKDLVEAPDDRVGGTRELRYLIVPREPGRYTIPAFEISAFDPAAASYVKVASAPLELEVVGRALTAPEPAAAATDTADAKPDDAAPAPVSDHEWRPIRTQSALLRKHTLLVREPWFFPLLALPGVIYAAFIVSRATRRRMHARAQTASNRAEREAREKLDAASAAAKRNDAGAFFAAAVSALLITLEARLGEPATGFTHGELRRHLLERGMDEALAKEIVSLLERADHQRFGGASTAASLDADLSSAKALRERIAAFQPREAA